MQQAIIKKIHAIRQKPQHVRERYLVLGMAIVTPFILTIWYMTFRMQNSNRAEVIKGVVGNVTNTLKDPSYKNMFSIPSADQVNQITGKSQ